jgi:hypothetical protein
MNSRNPTVTRRLPHGMAGVAAWAFAGLPGIALSQ